MTRKEDLTTPVQSLGRENDFVRGFLGKDVIAGGEVVVPLPVPVGVDAVLSAMMPMERQQVKLSRDQAVCVRRRGIEDEPLIPSQGSDRPRTRQWLNKV